MLSEPAVTLCVDVVLWNVIMPCAVVITRSCGTASIFSVEQLKCAFQHPLLVGVAQGSEGLCGVYLSTRQPPPFPPFPELQAVCAA
jgi:hypothetical protein